MSIQAFLAGVLIAAAGVAIIVYTEAIMAFAGRMDWAEKWMGMYGGTRLGYKLIGVIITTIGLLMATGLLGGIVLRLFGGLFSGFGPVPEY